MNCSRTVQLITQRRASETSAFWRQKRSNCIFGHGPSNIFELFTSLCELLAPKAACHSRAQSTVLIVCRNLSRARNERPFVTQSIANAQRAHFGAKMRRRVTHRSTRTCAAASRTVASTRSRSDLWPVRPASPTRAAKCSDRCSKNISHNMSRGSRDRFALTRI